MKNSYKLSISILFILFIGTCRINAQNNVFKINDELYDYYLKVHNNLNKRGLGLRMTDTLFVRSRQLHDLKAQCIALYLRVSYYYLVEDEQTALKELKRVAPFILDTPYTQYYFGGWTSVIVGLVNKSKYSEASTEIAKMQKQARDLKDDYGIVRSYMLLGDIYNAQRIYYFAYLQYMRALKYGEEHHQKDLSRFYLQMGQSCMALLRWEEAEKWLLKCLSCNLEDSALLSPYSFLLSLYCCRDTLDAVQIESCYGKLQNLVSKNTLLGTRTEEYNTGMYCYYQYYKNDSLQAEKYRLAGADPDSLSYYMYWGKHNEALGDYKRAAECYRSFSDWYYSWNIGNENLLHSSFVPQFEYQRMKFEKNNLLKQQTKLKMKNTESRTRILSLANERERAILIEKLKEHGTLKSELEAKKMRAMQQSKQIAYNQMMFKIRQKEDGLIRYNETWKILFGAAIAFAVLVIIVFLIHLKLKEAKRLKREKKQAEKSERIKGLFFQNMNHEIRSPLNAIVGFNELLSSDTADSLSNKEKEEFIGMISANSHLLMTLMNDVLDLSNFESGTYKLVPTDVDINNLCHITLESIRGRQNEGVELIFEPHPAGAFLLHTDAQRLQQVLVNYLTNACKYTEKGKITLSYEVLTDLVRFAVTDTGRGVKPEDVEKVFLRFEMLDKSKRGTGLGLHICRIVSNLLHGRTYVDTSYTGGARFIFDHPLRGAILILIGCFFSLLPLQAHGDAFPEYNAPVASAHQKQSSYSKEYNVRNLIAWSKEIKQEIADGRYKNAMHRLQNFQSAIVNEKDSYATFLFLELSAYFYQAQEHFSVAIKYYRQSLLYSRKDQYQVYLRIGQCFYEMENDKESVAFFNKALVGLKDAESKLFVYAHLLIIYSIEGQEKEADKYFNLLELLKSKHQTFLNNLDTYQNAVRSYYTNIKKNVKMGQEATKDDKAPTISYNVGNYCYSVGDYKRAMEQYKDYTKTVTQYMRNDYTLLFESFCSKFDFNQESNDKRKMELNNAQLQLSQMENNKKLLELTRQKIQWNVRKEDMNVRRKKSEILLQNSKMRQQDLYFKKQMAIKQSLRTEKDLTKQQLRWKLLTLIILSSAIIGVAWSWFIYLKRNDRELKKKANAAIEAEHNKNAFFESVSGKIRRQLDRIVELNKRLNSSSKNSTEERSSLMAQLSDNGSSLTSMVNRVLDISKMESGTFKLFYTDIDFYQLCKSVLTKMKAEVPHDVKLLFSPAVEDSSPVNTHCMITADVVQLTLILTAYLQNAFQHTTDGSVTLGYEYLPNNILRCYVADTGSGVDKKLVDDIFHCERMQSHSDKVGLSLHIVRLLTTMMNGRAYLDTKYTEGARFVFEIPLRPLTK